METYIYILIDPRSNQVRYVGKANNVKLRYKAHLNKARREQIHKTNWINCLKAAGLKPEIVVIDSVSIADWAFWESYWISQFKTWGFDLINYTSGGDGTTFANQTSFKKGDRAKPFIAFDKQGNKVQEFATVREAASLIGVHHSVVESVLRGRRKTCKSYTFLYKDIVDKFSRAQLLKLIQKQYVREHPPNSGQFKKGQFGIRSKPVIVTDLQTSEENVFSSGTEAAKRLGVCQALIPYAIKNDCKIRKRYKVKQFES